MKGHTDFTEIKTIDLTAVTDFPTHHLSHDYASRYTALPVKQEGSHLWVAMEDPLCIPAIMDLTDITGLFIVPMLARGTDIRRLIDQLYGKEAMHNIASQFLVEEKLKQRYQTPDTGLIEQLSAAPAVRLIDSLIESGILNRASDIHIEPYGSSLKARYRVDGELINFAMVDLSLLPNIISRLKIMGDLDISEKRMPQDGHFSMYIYGEHVEFRLSTMPTHLGEKAAIRLLYGQGSRPKKDQLGFFPKDLERLTRLFHLPHGAIFMTGPTGSGKSTTLTGFLEELNHEERNIITVEDPVENPLMGVNHVKVERMAGLDFANALRHILRQDPDIIMIGEIRDTETARIAIQAAITGHVVLSTLHTNDAAGVIERLMDMGIESYLVATALNGIIAQRLARRICIDCKTPARLTESQGSILKLNLKTPVFTGIGCGHCNNTGYKGRMAVYEYIIIDDELRSRMVKNPAKLAQHLRKKKGLRNNVAKNVEMGNITAEEALRVLEGEG
ncbi:MAG: GspE/PulE family protein [Defluviitaleaceae bacterium]|nr:GspE/PulE family protein [Defluviitaleaceae bacterium]